MWWRTWLEKLDAIQNGTHPESAASGSNAALGSSPPDASTPMSLEIEDLKSKVARLTETTTQHAHDIDCLTPMIEKVELAEKRIMRWRHRLP